MDKELQIAALGHAYTSEIGSLFSCLCVSLTSEIEAEDTAYKNFEEGLKIAASAYGKAVTIISKLEGQNGSPASNG